MKLQADRLQAANADPLIEVTPLSPDEVREAVARVRDGVAAGVCMISEELNRMQSLSPFGSLEQLFLTGEGDRLSPPGKGKGTVKTVRKTQQYPIHCVRHVSCPYVAYADSQTTADIAGTIGVRVHEYCVSK